MGLFDKIKDNAKTISMKALEATREYDEDYAQDQAAKSSAGSTVAPTEPREENAQVEPLETLDVADVTPVEEASAEQAPEPTEDVEFLIGESDEPAPAEAEPVKDDAPKDAGEDQEKAARKSKVTELSKEEYEQTKKAEKAAKDADKQAKEQEKAKQAAKERLAKSYTPSYKQPKSEEKIEVKQEASEPAVQRKPAPAPRSATGIIDVTPGKVQDPVKQAIYARERAALSALASQRKLNGTVPLYVATHMNFKTRVFINRIEYSGSFGKNVLPIEQVAWIKVRHGGTGVIIETVEGKRVVMVVKQADRLAFVDAIMKVQGMQPKKGKLKDTQTVRIDKLEQFGEGIDEIEKLAKLFDKGIISQDEFDAKKKQILGL